VITCYNKTSEILTRNLHGMLTFYFCSAAFDLSLEYAWFVVKLFSITFWAILSVFN